MPHIDGDVILGTQARLFGRERAPATHYAIAAALCDHDAAVISCGGGVIYGDAGKEDVRALIEGALSDASRFVTVETVAVVPRREGSTLADIFASHPAAEIARQRAKDGVPGWEGAEEEAFLKRIEEASLGNLRFAEMAVRECDTVAFWDYDRDAGTRGVPEVPQPRARRCRGVAGDLATTAGGGSGSRSRSRSGSGSGCRSEAPPGGTGGEGSGRLTVRQVRCAVLHEGRVRHITVLFSADRPVVVEPSVSLRGRPDTRLPSCYAIMSSPRQLLRQSGLSCVFARGAGPVLACSGCQTSSPSLRLRLWCP